MVCRGNGSGEDIAEGRGRAGGNRNQRRPAAAESDRKRNEGRATGEYGSARVHCAILHRFIGCSAIQYAAESLDRDVKWRFRIGAAEFHRQPRRDQLRPPASNPSLPTLTPTLMRKNPTTIAAPVIPTGQGCVAENPSIPCPTKKSPATANPAANLPPRLRTPRKLPPPRLRWFPSN